METTKPKTNKANIKPTKIKIANTEVVLGQTYEIAHKFDGSASDGMQSIGATKFPLEGVAEVKGLYFDENRNAFDTGFYVESVCNSNILQSESPADMVAIYEKWIKEPYEKRMNVNCSETNYEFWKNYKYEAKVNRSLNTGDPVELFELFHMLKQGAVCNEGEKNSVYQKARYTIKNLAVQKSKEDEKLDNKIKAITLLNTLLNSDPEKIYTVLEYLQMSSPRSMETETLRRVYMRMLDDDSKGGEFQRRFLEASDKYNSEQGKLEMEYFSMVQRLFLKGKITKKAGSLYHEDGMLLANSPKEIAIKCITDVDGKFKGSIQSLYDKYFTEE